MGLFGRSKDKSASPKDPKKAKKGKKGAAAEPEKPPLPGDAFIHYDSTSIFRVKRAYSYTYSS